MTVAKDVFNLAHADVTDNKEPEDIWYISVSETEDFKNLLGQLLDDPVTCVNGHFQSPILPKTQPIFVAFHYGLGQGNNNPYGTIQGVNNSNIVAVRCPPSQAPTQTLAAKAAIKAAKEMNNSLTVCYVPAIGLAFAHLELDIPCPDEASNWILDPQIFINMLNAVPDPVVKIATPMSYVGPGLDPLVPVSHVIFSLTPTFRFRYEYYEYADSILGADQCIKFAGQYQITQNDSDNVLAIQVDEAWSLPWQFPNGPKD